MIFGWTMNATPMINRPSEKRPATARIPACLPDPAPDSLPAPWPKGCPHPFRRLTAGSSSSPAQPAASGDGTGGDILWATAVKRRSEEHTSELQSHVNLVCRLLLEKKKKKKLHT